METTDRGHSTTRRWLIALLLLGLVPRLIAVVTSGGIMHPDEHQQYIEQSYRLLHGYGATFWEQDHGMRHPFMTLALTGILWVGEAVGLTDPHHLAALQRLVFCLFAYAAMSALAWSLFHQGRHVGGLVVAVFLVACVDLTFLHVRVMSENLSVAFLALALATGLRRPMLAGALLGLMVATRLQTAPLAAGVWAIATWHAWRRDEAGAVSRAVRLSGGLAVALVALGLVDRLHYGTWYHSVFANFQKNVVEDGASAWTTSPWYAYVLTGTAMLLRVSLFAIPALLWGARLRPALAAVFVLFIAAHSFIPHKEARYAWPAIPIVCLLMVVAVEDLAARGLFQRRYALAVLVVSLVAPSAVRIWLIRWNTEPYAAGCRGLADVSRQTDVREVALCGVPRFLAGNYFFLRHDVPLHYPRDAAELVKLPAWQKGHINYLIAPRDGLPEAGLEVVQARGNWVVCRRSTHQRTGS